MKTTIETNDPFVSRSITINSFGLNVSLIGHQIVGQIEDTQNLIQVVEKQTGQFRTITTISTANGHMNKRNNPFWDQLIKKSVFQMRLGVNYENKKDVIALREAGKLPEPPKGKVWIEHPYWMKSLKTGELLIAGTPVKGSKHSSTYFDLNFVEIPKETIKPYFKKKSKSAFEPKWFTPEFRSVVRIT
jgi:hypothetical protein